MKAQLKGFLVTYSPHILLTVICFIGLYSGAVMVIHDSIGLLPALVIILRYIETYNLDFKLMMFVFGIVFNTLYMLFGVQLGILLLCLIGNLTKPKDSVGLKRLSDYLRSKGHSVDQQNIFINDWIIYKMAIYEDGSISVACIGVLNSWMCINSV